jgi:predicted nucleotidyltransferase component of viral defense system
MLHKQTIEPRTLSVLNAIMHLDKLSNFSLVGGTALSLKYGHRISTDLDLFCNQVFENELVIQVLENAFGNRFQINSSTKIGIFGFIDDIKIDLIRYPFQLIKPIEIIEHIRLYSTEDIIAMKIQAVLGRAKKKDFFDIAMLMQHFSISFLIECHNKKFSNQFLMISVPQALCYFDEAEESENAVALNNWNWNDVKMIIQQKVAEFLT